MSEPLLLKDEVFAITGCAMSVLNNLGHGFHEKIYENALAIEFEEQSIAFEKQHNFDVFYKGREIGHYIPDFVVMDKIIVELKTLNKIGSNEIGQVINYLKVTNLNVGVILNFKYAKLDWKRVVL